MSISIIADNKSVNVKFLTFSDGGEYLKIDFPDAYENMTITIKDEPVGRYPWLLSLIKSVYYRKYNSSMRGGSISLNLPYMPFARADREFESGMINPLEAFIYDIPHVFDNIYLTDVHSDVAIDLLECNGINVEHKEQYKCVQDVRNKLDLKNKNLVLVAPDKGAENKALKIKQFFDIDVMLVCEKDRDPTTAWITSTYVTKTIIKDVKSAMNDDNFQTIKGRDCLIVDDICDGGATFVMLAKMLKDEGAKSVTLYVTHGIFAKGLELFKPYIDKIVAYQLIGGYVTQQTIEKYNEDMK